MEYSIYNHNNSVGRVLVTREGMYYRLYCKIAPVKKAKYRIVMHTDGAVIDMGLCIVSGNDLELTTRVRMKDVNTEKIRFYAMPYGCYPITENGSFPYLHKLRHACLNNAELPIAVFAQDAD